MAENNITSISEGNMSVHVSALNVKPNVVLSIVVVKPTKKQILFSSNSRHIKRQMRLCPHLVSFALESIPHMPCRGQLKQAVVSGDFQLGSANGRLWQEIRREEPEVYVPPHRPTWGAREVAQLAHGFFFCRDLV